MITLLYVLGGMSVLSSALVIGAAAAARRPMPRQDEAGAHHLRGGRKASARLASASMK